MPKNGGQESDSVSQGCPNEKLAEPLSQLRITVQIKVAKLLGSGSLKN